MEFSISLAKSKKGRIEDIISYLRRAARQNHTKAILLMGYAYDEGRGVPKNFGRAFEYFLQAAKNDDPDAQYELGMYYHRGKHVSFSEKIANRWFGFAAKRNHVPSQIQLGKYYLDHGHYLKARYYLRKADDNCNEEAALLLEDCARMMRHQRTILKYRLSQKI